MKKLLIAIVLGCLAVTQVYAAVGTIALIIFTAKALGYTSLGVSAIEAVAEVFETKGTQKEIANMLNSQISNIEKITNEREALLVADPKEYERRGYVEQDKALMDERLELQNVLYQVTEGNYEVMREKTENEVINISKGYATGLVAQGATTRLVGAAAGTQGLELTSLGTEFFEALAAHGQGSYDTYKALIGSTRSLTEHEKLFLESLSSNAKDVVDFSIAKAVFRKVLYDNGYILPTGDEPISDEEEMKYMQQYLGNDPLLRDAYLQAIEDKTGSKVDKNWDCDPKWTCNEWTKCLAGRQTRNCMDVNGCNSTYDKPVSNRACEMEKCMPSWNCGDWSTCSGSKQTRTCSDKNKCGVSTGKPAVSQSCKEEKTEDGSGEDSWAARNKIIEDGCRGYAGGDDSTVGGYTAIIFGNCVLHEGYGFFR